MTGRRRPLPERAPGTKIDIMQSGTTTRFALKKSRLPAGLLLLILAYPPYAFSEMKDMVKFEVARKYYQQGNRYFNNMQYLAAAEFFRKAVKEYPDYYTARDHLARAYKLAGFSEPALKEWENLLEDSPDNVAVAAKIESLRFQNTPAELRIDTPNYVFHETYKSSKFKRFRFHNPVDLAVDNDRNLYITSFSGGDLVKIDSNGNAVDAIRTSLNGKLYGIDYRNGKLAVSDFAKDRIYILDKKGAVISQFGSSGDGEGQFHGPEGLCFGGGGEVYVVDSGNCRVQKFDDRYRFILQFGKKGEYEGELSKPADVAVHRDRVYVTDTGNRRIACFDDSGNFVRNISIEDMEYPRGITRLKDTLLLSDEKKGLLFYDIASGSASWFSSFSNVKDSVSRLVSTAVDRDGYLYCLDYNREAVALFSPAHKQYSNMSVEITSVDTASFPVVAFYANIRSKDGSPVYGLDAANFTITENGAPITNVYTDYLKRMLPSVSIALCVDRSKTAESYRGDLPWVAEFILQKMHKNDSLEVLNFNDDTWVGNKFDWSRRRTLKALKDRAYGGGKGIGRALYQALSDVVPRLNRRGVVLVTDGTVDDDSFRTYSPETIIRYAQSHYIPVYIISFREPHRYLRDIAAATGGALYRPSQLDGLRSIYGAIKNSEEYRYVLVYSTYRIRNFSGWWADVKIEVNNKGELGTEWGGYFVP